MAVTKTSRKESRHPKKTSGKNAVKKKDKRGFEKAWEFWQKAQIDLSNFKFDREEANAR